MNDEASQGLGYAGHDRTREHGLPAIGESNWGQIFILDFSSRLPQYPPMARPLRIQYENACYHITCRGNGRQNIFLADYDRSKFLDLLQRSVEIYRVDLIAFVLMTNHFHLIAKTPRANLQEFMRHFSISYTVGDGQSALISDDPHAHYYGDKTYLTLSRLSP